MAGHERDPSTEDAGILASVLTYTANYSEALQMPPATATGVWSFSYLASHLWSLAVEEQFYLLWPLALLLVTPKRAARALIAVAVGVAIWRGTAIAIDTGLYPYRAFETTGDFLALGCLVGVLLRGRALALRGGSWLALASVVVAVALVRGSILTPLSSWTLPLSALLMACAVAAAVSGPVGMLAFAPLRWLGLISYPLYLWHGWGQYFAAVIPASFWIQATLGLALSVALASFSYYGLERHVLLWRDRNRVQRITAPA